MGVREFEAPMGGPAGMRMIVARLFKCLGLFVAAAIVPAISHGDDWGTLLLVGAILGLANFALRPLVILITLPALVISLGIGGVHATTPAAGAISRAHRALASQDSLVGRNSRAWSAPVVLAECRLASGPRIAFPSEGPATPTGTGAVVWASNPAPCGSSAPRPAPWGLSVAALGSTDRPMLVSTQSLEGAAPITLAAVGASFGRVVLTVASAIHESAGDAIALLQGHTTARPGWPRLALGWDLPLALTRGYLGDAALAAVSPGPRIEVRVERFSQHGFGRARSIPIRAGRVTALTAAMDYRSDVLLAWQQDGAIYAHMLRISGRSDPTQRVGPSDPNPQIQAVVSDDDHGMIAWSSTEIPKRSTATTRIYLSLSAAGVRFRAPKLLAAFTDPVHLGRRPGSLALERLSTENVMLAWSVLEHGHYLIRAAPAVFAASRPSTRLSDPHSQAILAGLAPGPAGEAMALWSSAPRLGGGGLDAHRAELWATRTYIRHSRVVFGGPEMITPAGPNVTPTVAVDPANDRAVAAWMTLGATQRIEYAVGAGAAGYRPRPLLAAAVPPAAGTHWLRIALVAAGLVGVGLLALAIRRRRQMAET